MLSVEQYQALAGLIPSINAELRKNGIVLDGDDDADRDGEEEATSKPSKSAHKSKTPSKKANIEATSDEEED